MQSRRKLNNFSLGRKTDADENNQLWFTETEQRRREKFLFEI